MQPTPVIRHGTTTLSAALNVATGQILPLCEKPQSNQEFLAFLNYIEASAPEDKELQP